MAVKSKKPFKPQALTANLLVGGEVVYMREDATWSEDLKDACVLETAERLGAAEVKANAAIKAQKIVDAYPFEVSIDDGLICPASVREKIRAKGPTVRLDLGKQAA